MENYDGKRMGKLYLRFHSGKAPYLTDAEAKELRDWMFELYRYNSVVGDKIHTIYYANKYETLCNICEARNEKDE